MSKAHLHQTPSPAMGEWFASTVLTGQLLVAVPVALIAGLVSFVSPCVLPLVPAYVGYVGGMSSAEGSVTRSRVTAGVALFVLGFAVVFVAYGAAFGAAGAWLVRWQGTISQILGVLVVVMGIAFLGGIRPLQRTLKLNTRPLTGLAGAPLMGVVFGVGWTPCMGPTLAAISLLSLDAASPWRGALLGFAYCLGLGVPFLLVAFGFGKMTRTMAFLRSRIRTINMIGGVLLIILGILMVTGVWTSLIYGLQGLISSTTLPI
ncbi:cytochrome c biogenesis CcdA family protein [Herbiconiux sp. YIM B11900]|uniref:cytochrome c biogenesis CcdA family protein n=1 Tax=Herbiconiux sp. YIM B11900 TaxID=3404131 RepID=UPI003F83818E